MMSISKEPSDKARDKFANEIANQRFLALLEMTKHLYTSSFPYFGFRGAYSF